MSAEEDKEECNTEEETSSSAIAEFELLRAQLEETQREVDHLVAKEWAVTVDDILWRRTKLGLRFDRTQVDALDVYLRR